jgi:quercetin dioxygenase-like cupin family protein
MIKIPTAWRPHAARVAVAGALTACSGWGLFAQQAPARAPVTVMHPDDIPWTKGDPTRFSGVAETQPMPLPPGDVRVSRIRHEPGAHTIWHVHKGGQVIYVESGRGLIQKWGGEIQEMRPGDIVYSAPGEKHWHGAAPGSPLTFVATSLGETEWLEPVQLPSGKQPDQGAQVARSKVSSRAR